ncbi:MAG TPA: lantibiotic dehydratase [Bacillus sp. (in: firmicutes)]|nr:lantibiotic dehydratase [Bacillus sp. (in: firmicutes)]
MSQEANLYRALDFFMLRIPMLSLNNYKNCFPTDWENQEELRRYTLDQLIALSKDPMVREAIAVSSPSLLESIAHLGNEKNPRKQGQVIKGFMRYLIRMMTRPTPFGLFSGVTYGYFGDKSQVLLKNTSSHRKRVRPDMEWLLKIIEMIESQRHLVAQLKVKRNPLIYRQGERAKIPYTARYGKLGPGENDSVSVRATTVFDVVMESSADPVPYKELVHILQSKFTEASEQTIHDYVWKLFEQEFLISSLRPPTTITEPFDYVLSILEPLSGMDSLKNELFQVREEIGIYEKMVIGHGEKYLLNLQKKMKQIADVSSQLQIDMVIDDRSIVLHNRIRKDVERVADLFFRISEGYGYQHLDEYLNNFIEKYGPYREIPLLELLDEEMGLGAPATYLCPQSRKSLTHTHSSFENKQAQMLLRWVIACLNKGEQELNLTEAMMDEMAKAKNASTLPALPSIELYLLVLGQNAQDLDNGNYTLLLGPTPGTNAAGKTFGRFIYLLDDSFKKEFSVINREEQELTLDTPIAEISYLPSAGRAANVVLTENFREYEIGIGTNLSTEPERQISINDLVVGVKNNCFYIKSLQRNQEVISSACHMLNLESTPNVYRFLREVGLYRYRRWTTMNFGELVHSPFIPRIRYSNIIISPATWKLTIDQETIEREDGGGIESIVRRFREEWCVPRYVNMIYLDNRILFDLDHPLHVEEICKDLKKQGEVTLIEHLGGYENQPILRENDRFIAEFVFPLVRSRSKVETAASEVASAQEPSHRLFGSVCHPGVDESKRIIFPGGPWLYAKLYGMDSRQDEFLGRHWQAFCQQCKDMNLIDHAYFVRYADPDRHLRVRFHSHVEQGIGALLPVFHEWTQTLYQEGLISKIVVDTYEPEIERYGGPNLMPLAEALFSHDSEVVSYLIQLVRFSQLQIDKLKLSVISVLELLRQFGLTDDETASLLNKKYDVKDYLDDFRKDRKYFMELLAGHRDKLEPSYPNESLVYQIMDTRYLAVKRYVEELARQEELGMLLNAKEDILFSVIHMHLNRLLGINRNQEEKVMILARHTINSLVQYRRKRR